MAKYSNALNIDYALYCQGHCICDGCGDEADWWEICDSTSEAAKRLDELGWNYLDAGDCLNCPVCSTGKKRAVKSMPLFDAIDAHPAATPVAT